jgi:hypothetical protein
MGFYEIALTAHSLVRWVVLGALGAAVVRAVRGWMRAKP